MLQRLTRVVESAGRAYTYAYEDSGDLSTLTYPNGTSTTSARDARHRLLSLVARRLKGQVLHSYEDTLVRMGQRAGAREGDAREYEDDALGRLAGERLRGGASPGCEEAFAYDAVGKHTGRRRSDTTGTTTTLLAYDTRDRLPSVGGAHPFNLAPSSSQK